MHRYETLEQLGNGSFGEVVKARSRKTNEVVAIKKMKALFPTWEECLQLRELKSLRVLRHENIVQLKEVIQDKEELYFVFEYMHSSLCKVMRQMKRQQQTGAPSSTTDDAATSSVTSSSAASAASMWFSEAQVRSIMYQLFCGLAHMHKHGFFHRDIKPENLLCHDETLKIADLGQAREIRSRPPFTDYVATRWYRSPELLLRAMAYNSPIDLWACGCIMAELYLQTPLFSGSSEADQMCRICKVLGTPTKENWPDGMTMVAQMQFKFPKCAPVPWSHVLPSSASKAAIQLIQELLQYDPSRRLTAAQALQHRFFDQSVARPMLTTTTTAQSSSSSTALHATSSAALPVKAEFKSTVSYAAACSYGSTGGGASSKKAVDETLAAESSSRWTRKDLSAASGGASSDTVGSSRKEWSSSSAYDLASATTSSSSSAASAAHWSAKQTAAAMDKLFVQHSPRESESWAADAKTSRRDRAGVGAKIDTTLAAAAKQRDARSGSDSYSSAHKFSPSPEEEDDDNEHNEFVRDTADQERQRRRGDDSAQREGVAGGVATHRAHALRKQNEDHLLQDLLDEFIA